MINVDVYVPAMDEVVDFELDEESPVSQILNEMTDILARRVREDTGRQAGEFVLCLEKEERVLPGQMTLQMCGIKNGDRLILV